MKKLKIIMGSLGQDKCEYNMPFPMVVDAETEEFVREATEEERKRFYDYHQKSKDFMLEDETKPVAPGEIQQVRPISPNELVTNEGIPKAMIQAVNELLSENYRGGSVRIKVHEIEKRYKSISGQKTCESSYLNFENMYRDFGWDVTYDTPARDEDFAPFYLFKRK